MHLHGIVASLENLGDVYSEVAEDVAGEIESMQAADDIDDEIIADPAYLPETDDPNDGPEAKRLKSSFENLEKHIEKASENVIVVGTANEYRKYVPNISVQSVGLFVNLKAFGRHSMNSVLSKHSLHKAPEMSTGATSRSISQYGLWPGLCPSMSTFVFSSLHFLC